jgi:hypothetical protein
MWPDPHHLIGEPAPASTIAANAVIGEVAPHHRGQMAMLVAGRPVAVSPTPVMAPQLNKAGSATLLSLIAIAQTLTRRHFDRRITL